MSVTQPVPSSVTVSLPKLLIRAGGGGYRVADAVPPALGESPVASRLAMGIVLSGDDVILVPGEGGSLGLPVTRVGDSETPAGAISCKLVASIGTAPLRSTLAVEAWDGRGDAVTVTQAFICDMPADGKWRGESPRVSLRTVIGNGGTDAVSHRLGADETAILRTLFPYG